MEIAGAGNKSRGGIYMLRVNGGDNYYEKLSNRGLQVNGSGPTSPFMLFLFEVMCTTGCSEDSCPQPVPLPS